MASLFDPMQARRLHPYPLFRRRPLLRQLHSVRAKGRRIEIDYDTGETFILPAEFLRVESPSAEVQGHGGAKTVVPGKAAVAIRALEPVGHYALRITFDDGHDTGLYSWDYLRKLALDHDTLWADYLQRLTAKGLSREA